MKNNQWAWIHKTLCSKTVYSYHFSHNLNIWKVFTACLQHFLGNFREYKEFEGKYRNFRNGFKILGNIRNFRNTRHPVILILIQYLHFYIKSELYDDQWFNTIIVTTIYDDQYVHRDLIFTQFKCFCTFYDYQILRLPSMTLSGFITCVNSGWRSGLAPSSRKHLAICIYLKVFKKSKM